MVAIIEKRGGHATKALFFAMYCIGYSYTYYLYIKVKVDWSSVTVLVYNNTSLAVTPLEVFAMYTGC